MSTKMIAALMVMFAIPAFAADTTLDQQEAVADLQKRAAASQGQREVQAKASRSAPRNDSTIKPGEVTVTHPKKDHGEGSSTGM
jgi:hypothetical protein